MKTQEAVHAVLAGNLQQVPPEIIVWTDTEGVEWTAAEMLAMLCLNEAPDIVLRWFNNVVYSSLLRYRANEQV